MAESSLKAVLLDVGQPLVEDSTLDLEWNEWFAGYLSDHFGREVTLESVLSVRDSAIRCYAPSIFSYTIWNFVKPDLDHFKTLRRRFDTLDYSKYLQIRPEAVEICAVLSEKYTLATAANQPAVTRQILEDAGILRHFKFKEMSGAMQYSKPDLRFFLHILEQIGVEPEEAVMVGDRQDNDIVPAKLLGMKAIRWRGGLFKDQEVRMPSEEPDGNIEKLSELPGALEKLI